MENLQTQYNIVKGNANDEELERYRECFYVNGTTKSLNVLKWFHQQNLRNSNSIYYALTSDTGSIAAIYTYLPVIFRCMGKLVNGMQSFDTLTDKNHRSKGLFIKLASKIEKEETLNNNELVYGFPNENSIHGFVNKLGFTYFGEVPFLIKPFRVSYFIQQILKTKKEDSSHEHCTLKVDKYIKIKQHTEIREILEFDNNYDALYNLVSSKINIGVNRNASYMNWRYVSKPEEQYCRYGIYDKDQLTGVIVFTLKAKHNGKIGYLMELIFDPKNETAPKYLLKFCSVTLRRNKADLILAWCFNHSFNYNAIRRSGYYRFPEKLRPQKLGFITKALNNNENKNEINNIKNWYISYSDSDTV